ncbi:hypothetical protein C8R44DRAFT_737334 [Mycena epipterygia]|nr:hypothetical protein C8R44DRAFT_737334 [Mycena epipterygia]
MSPLFGYEELPHPDSEGGLEDFGVSQSIVQTKFKFEQTDTVAQDEEARLNILRFATDRRGRLHADSPHASRPLAQCRRMGACRDLVHGWIGAGEATTGRLLTNLKQSEVEESLSAVKRGTKDPIGTEGRSKTSAETSLRARPSATQMRLAEPQPARLVAGISSFGRNG